MADARNPPRSVRSSVATRRALSPRLSRSLLIALLVTLLLSLLELGLVWLLNPLTLPGRNSSQRFAALMTLPLHLPLLWLIPIAEGVAIALGTFALIEPLAFLAYARAVRGAQERFRSRYTSLTSLAAMYKTPVVYYRYTPDHTSPQQEQSLTLNELLTLLQDNSLLLLGTAGMGKTLALQHLQYAALQQPSALWRGHKQIPIYLPLTYYCLYLKSEQRGRMPVHKAGEARDADEQPAPAPHPPQQSTLLAYLSTSDLPGLSHLRPYLSMLMEQGRLVLLCDGLDEVDPLYRSTITADLTGLLLRTSNRCVITCRELDYQEQQELLPLIDEGHIERALLKPLRLEQVREFIEQYLADQQGTRLHTAGQIMRLIEHSRLRHLCVSPFMLCALLEIIDAVGIERGKQLDTRGLLLQEYTLQLIDRAQKQPAMAGDSAIIVQALSTIACAARWSKDAYAIDIISDCVREIPGGLRSEVWAKAFLAWSPEHQARGPLECAPAPLANDPPVLACILDFATSAGLIDITARGILSFRHALCADYWVAEYFSNNAAEEQASAVSLAGALLAHVEDWSNPIALWAGLLENPLQLANWIVEVGGVQEQHVQNLVLSLVCVGVAWIPPQAGVQQENALSTCLLALLSNGVHHASSRVKLAHYCTLCAAGGVQEIYYALLSLLMVEGIEVFLVLLDETVVPELLFTYLCDIVDVAALDAQVKRLCRILRHFGEIAVDQAEQLSQPMPARSLRLRAAAMNILGGTRSDRAVEPLLAGLTDAEQFIVERSINALWKLGPELSLLPIIRGLEHRGPGPLTRQVHEAILTILMRYLEERDPHKRLTLTQYERILERAIAVLGANYASEIETQQLVQRLLVRLAQAPSAKHNLALADAPSVSSPASGDAVRHMLFHMLITYLSSPDEVLVRNVIQVLRQSSPAAIPYLLEHECQREPEMVRVRLVEILKDVRDSSSLPHLLRLIADPSLLVQQQVLLALRNYSPASIPGLIDLILSDPSELMAERAAYTLGEIGAEVVGPLVQALSLVVAGRTRLLVQVAERLHDRSTLPALIHLLRAAQADVLLTIAVIRALGQFATREVVVPILEVLANPQPQIYEEAINALSALGSVALDSLLSALKVQEEAPATPRIHRALLGMLPFPGEALLQALATASDAQAHQIMIVLRAQGADAAHVLVQHLFDENPRVRRYVRQTLTEIAGVVAVPALLEVLQRAAWRDDVAELLLRYPEAISPLVKLLGDHERAEAALAILPRFGSALLVPLIAGLADERRGVQVHAQSIIVALVRQKPATIFQVVGLFASSLPMRAHESLMELLTTDLVSVSVPVLLDGLEHAHLVEHASEALLRLVRKPDWRIVILDGLVTSLRREERRRGAEITLIKMGALAVGDVGELIAERDRQVAQAAQNVLREIGAPALPFIWAAYGDTGDRARRDAALQVLHGMPTRAMKDALVELLNGEKSEDFAMAQALLLERVSAEVKLPQASHEMIPALLAYVQVHAREVASLRIFALLMLLGGEAVINHLVELLYANPEHQERLTHAFLFLGEEAQAALLQILKDAHAPARLRGEAVSILGLLGSFKEVYEYAQVASNYGLSPEGTGELDPDELTISLRALGSLLASGDWDLSTLQNLERISQGGSSEHELYQVLLGRRHGPEITRLQNELQNERDARKSEVMHLTARLVQNREHIHELAEQLEQASFEHGMHSDELNQVCHERDTYWSRLNKALQERDDFRNSLEQALQMQQSLQAEVTQLQSYNAQLLQQLKQLRGAH